MRYDTKQDLRDANDESSGTDRHFSRAKVVISAIGLAVTVGLALVSLVDNLQQRINRIDIAVANATSVAESCRFEQHPSQLCHRISTCQSTTNTAIYEIRSQIAGVRDTLTERGNRISNLEIKVYELAERPKSRPDPFTGTMGTELEQRLLDRIKALEESKP